MSEGSHNARVMKNSVGFLFANVLGSMYSIVTIPYLTRTLGPLDWGFFSILLQAKVFLEFSALVLFQQAVLKFFVEYEGIDRKRFIGTAWVVVGVVQSASVIVFFLGRGWLLPMLFTNIEGHALDPYIGWACIWFLAVPLRQFGFSLFRIEERVPILVVLNIIYGIILFSMLFLFVGTSEDRLAGAIKAMAIAEWGGFLIVFFVQKAHVHISFDALMLKRMIVFSSPLLAGSVCFLIINQVDRVILSRHGDLAVQGVYSVGNTIGGLLSMVVSSYMSSASPRMVNVLWSEGDESGSMLASRLFSDSIIFIGVPYACLCLGGDLLVSILGGAGQDWSLARKTLIGIATGNFVRGIAMSAMNVYFYKNRTLYQLYANLVLLVLSVGLGIMLASVFSVVGISWILASCYLMIMFPLWKIALSLLPFTVNWREILLPLCGIGIVLIISVISVNLEWGWSLWIWWVARLVGVAILALSCGSKFVRLFSPRCSFMVHLDRRL
jgi:O-antigen/teichoic acid export membrane protein